MTTRVLCAVCYATLWKKSRATGQDELAEWRTEAGPASVYCDCDEFVAEAIPLFLAVQCATCKRPERPAA